MHSGEPQTEHKEPYPTRKLLRTIWHFIQPHGAWFVWASVMRLISDIVWLYPAYALSAIVTLLTTADLHEAGGKFVTIITLWTVVSIIRFVCIYFARYWGMQLGEKADLKSQQETIKHLFFIDIAWHEKENAGNKMKKIDRGSTGINTIIRMWFANLIEIAVNIVGITFIISQFDTMVDLVTALFLLTYFLIASYYRRHASAASQEVNIEEENLDGLLYESINNIRSVKVMSMAPPLSKYISQTAATLFDKVKKRIFWFQSGSGIKNLWGQIFRLGMILYIGYGIIHGQYQIGFLVLFYAYFNNIWTSVSELADTTQDFTIAKYGIQRMTQMLEVPIEIDREEGKKAFPKEWQTIKLENVSFAYGEKKVLDSVSFDIHRGEKIGLVGLSGAGKSTIFKLLLKEHEDYQGSLTVDGTPLKDISKKDYFSHVAVVLQDTEVFNFSLRDNITISNHEQKDNEQSMNRALEIAHVGDFARALPRGLDTFIGEKGVRLSGGEKQRVGIARAVFKDPQFLLLDEATSHLDIESEEKIRDSLHQFFKSVTALVIAHRLTTIKEMDRILVLEKGKILESGTFNELHEKKGRFYELWEKQKL